MPLFKRIIRRIGPLLFAAVIAVSAMALPGTLAIVTDHTAPIVNTFCPDEIACAEGEVDVQVLKTMRNLGEKTLSPQGFQFVLTNVKTGETATATTGANGKAAFHLSFHADDAGSHLYRLTEVKGTVPGVTYSELSYTVRVDVTLTDALNIAVYLDGEKTSRPQARFENLYDSSAAPETGDAAPLLGYALALLAGLAGVCLLIRKAESYAA